MSAHAVPMAVYAGQQNENQQQQRRQLANTPDKWLHKTLYAGGLISVAGGMELALGLGWSAHTGIKTTLHLQCSWFIGGIVGAILATPFIAMLSKRFYLRCSALLLIITGIVYISAPRNYAAMVGARYVSGLAIGWACIAFIVHASEIALPKYRGSCLAMEQYSTCIGIAVQVAYASQWTASIAFAANRLHGIFILLLALLAFACTWLIIESPIFHIRNNSEALALVCQQRLLRCAKGAQVDTTTRFLLEDNRNYVLENENRTTFESCVEGLLPALKLSVYRCCVAFSFALPLSEALQYSSRLSLGYDNGWPALIFGILRMLTALSTIYLLDMLGRKLLSLLSLGLMAVMTIAVGGIFSGSVTQFDNDFTMAIACTLILIQQIFAGFFAPSTSVYLGEAFPMRVKPHLIACCIFWEYLIHIIVICTFDLTAHNIYAYLVAVGVFMLLASCAFIALLPETRHTTLREAQDRFRRFYTYKFY